MILQTEDVVVNLQENNSIILNCTYKKDEKDYISDGNIRWQKKIGGKYKDMASFAPPGSAFKPFIHRDMWPLYNNRTELIVPNISLAAVMIIKDPVCSDGGTYRCRIEYYYDSLPEVETSISVVSFNGKYKLLFFNIINSYFKKLKNNLMNIFFWFKISKLNIWWTLELL